MILAFVQEVIQKSVLSVQEIIIFTPIPIEQLSQNVEITEN